MNGLQFIPACVEDIPLIFDQCKALVDRYEDKTLVDYEKVLKWLRNKVETKIAQYTCVLFNGEKAAYYCLDQGDDMWELDDLYVLPAFRNMGIGSAVIEKCIQESDKPLMLYVFTENSGAISLYKRHCFASTEQLSATRFIMVRRT